MSGSSKCITFNLFSLHRDLEVCSVSSHFAYEEIEALTDRVICLSLTTNKSVELETVPRACDNFTGCLWV